MPCRLATAAIGSRSASRRIATTCSSVNLDLRMLPSESEGSLSSNPWSEITGAGQEACCAAGDIRYGPAKARDRAPTHCEAEAGGAEPFSIKSRPAGGTRYWQLQLLQ